VAGNQLMLASIIIISSSSSRRWPHRTAVLPPTVLVSS
jgi:hypothetical protein